MKYFNKFLFKIEISSRTDCAKLVHRLRKRGFEIRWDAGIYNIDLKNESFFFYVSLMSSITSGGGWEKI